MPGNFFTLICSGCLAEHEMHTGTPLGGGLIEQRVCPRCQRIVSCWPQDPGEKPKRCPNCDGSLEPWAGRVWLEPRPDESEGDLEERCEGPCPQCGTKITKADSNGMIGLWD